MVVLVVWGEVFLVHQLQVHQEVDHHITEKLVEFVEAEEVEVAAKIVLKTLKIFVAVICVQVMVLSPERGLG